MASVGSDRDKRRYETETGLASTVVGGDGEVAKAGQEQDKKKMHHISLIFSYVKSQ
jgi:hypothetical protein